MPYTFQTELLSASKTGSPQLFGTTLSAVAVTFLSGDNVTVATQQAVVVALSGDDAGLAFNPVTYTIPTQSLSTFSINNYSIVTLNVNGSVFRIPGIAAPADFALIENANNNYTVFSWVSSVTMIASSAISSDTQVSTPNTRRLRLLGYK